MSPRIITGLGVGVVLTLTVIAVISPPQSEEAIQCMDAEMREKVRALMIKALDEAFVHRVDHLFEIWMRDATDQPRRATNGTRAAVRAYVNARTFAERQWNPPPCESPR